MSIFDIFKRRPKANIPPGYDWAPWQLATAEQERWSVPDLTLPEAQSRLYLQLPWINAAIGAVARAVALQALSVFELAGEEKQDVENHPFELLLNRPNPLQSRYEFLYAVAAWTKLTGNCYIWLRRGNPNQPPAELWILPTRQVKPVPDEQLYIKGYVYDPGNGQEEPLETWEVCHVRNFHPSNAFVGASDIEALATAAESDHAMAQWNRKFFSKENAKMPGMLAFSDFIPNDTWERMRRDFIEQHGGTERSLRMIRGVGAGGVQWLPTAMSQSDMEFLAGRTFTRDEIWSVLAPGLANITVTNATMANAEAGKRTFTELAVWPLCVNIAQKFTNDVLPSYGEGLVCDFDDPRITDRALELQERAEWSKVHTVAESRKKWDGDDPLGDERDALLVPQVAQLGGTPEIEKPGPTPPQLMPFTGGPQEEAEAVEEPETEAEPEEPEEETEGALEAARTAELAKWRRYAVRHGAQKARGFKAELLPADVVGVIRDRLALSEGAAEEVKAAFSGPFLVKAIRRTAGGLKDPAGDAKDAAEARIARLLRARLNGQMDDVMKQLGDPPRIENLPYDFWETQTGRMVADLRPELTRLAAQMAEDEIEAGVGISWDVVNEGAADWAARYTFGLISDVNETTLRVLRKGVERYYQESGRTMGDLTKELEPWFGRTRAERIAVTEVTRAAAEGERIVERTARDAGIRLVAIWHTNRDELVCNICGPNDGKAQPEWVGVEDIPPAHPNCRCWVTHEYVPTEAGRA